MQGIITDDPKASSKNTSSCSCVSMDIQKFKVMMDQNGILLAVQEGINDTPADVRGKYSDGYHTFNELYEFRKAYNAALFNEWGHIVERWKDGFAVSFKYDVHKSWRHHDGELCFGGGWFIVVAILPTGQISQHYPECDWDLFKIPEVEKAKYPFDGHSPADVLSRLKALKI